MRKFVAGLFTAVVAVPLVSAALFMLAARPWILDGDFYRAVAADERLYRGWAEGASRAITDAVRDDGLELDAAAVRSALEGTISDAEAAELVSGFVGDVVDDVRALPFGADPSLDLAPVKRIALDRLPAFAAAYAAAAPTGVPEDADDYSERPASVPANRWASGVESALRRSVESAPDTVSPPRENAVARRGVPTPPGPLRFLSRSRTLGSALDRMTAFTSFAAALVVVASAMASSSRWKDRFRWAGGALGFPSFLLIAAGALCLIGGAAVPSAGGAAGAGFVAERISAWVAEAYRAAGSDVERIAAALAIALSRIGRSFFITGLISAAISAAFSSARFFGSDDEKD